MGVIRETEKIKGVGQLRNAGYTKEKAWEKVELIDQKITAQVYNMLKDESQQA